MLGASLVAAYSVARLAVGVTAATMATAAVGSLLVAVLHRRRALAVAVGVAGVAVGALWSGLGASGGSGVPTPAALGALRASLRAARGLLVSFDLPLVHTAGVVVLCALAGGLAAVAGRALGIRHPALALAPALVILVWSATLLPTTGAAVAGLALGGCGFLVLLGDGAAAPGSSAALVAGSLGLAALTVGWAAPASSNVAAPGGPRVPAVAPSALSLATDLTGVESRDAHVVLFRAQSPVPTYWQVATLSSFVGDRWVPGPATAAVLHGSAPTRGSAPASGPHLFDAGVTLSGFSGRLLPAPPSTVAASGATSPVVTSSGVVAALPVQAGSRYTVTAVVPSPVADTTAGPPAPGVDTALGPIPATVRSLARTVTAGQTSPLDKAEALTDFFRSGRFHYSIDARQPVGVDPLVAFLTQTRTGSCEEFAGSFAVLARASGLPTRVAVGFTPGRPSNGVTVVRGSDAHAWPEVLIDGTWVSFEPTPQLPSGELSPPGVLGPTGLGQPNPTGRGGPPPPSVPVATTPVPTTPPPAGPNAVVTRTAPGAGPPAVVLAVLAVVAAAGLVAWRRRRRDPVDRVVLAWRSIDRALARRGTARPRWRTPVGHVGALAGRHGDERARAALEDMAVVATTLQDVTYGSLHLSADDAGRAVQAGRRARRAVLAGALRGSGATGPETPAPSRWSGAPAGARLPGHRPYARDGSPPADR